MSSANFLNANAFRTFPLKSGSNLPDSLLVDAGVIMGPLSDWDHTAAMEVTTVSYSAPNLTITFTTDTYNFTFTVPNTVAAYTTLWEDEANGADYGSMFITIGPATSTVFATIATPVGTLMPTLIQNLKNHRVRTISVANKYSLQYTNSTCSLGLVDTDGEEYKVEAADLTGAIQIKAGRYVNISSVTSDNTVYISANSNQLQGGELPCAPMRVLPDSYVDSNEPKCSDLLYSINGVYPVDNTGVFRLTGSQGTVVGVPDDSTPHTIVITFKSQLLFAPSVPGPECD